MAKLDARDTARVNDIAEQVDIIRLDRRSSMGEWLSPIRALLEADNLLMLRPTERLGGGWDIEQFHHDRFPHAAEFERRFIKFFESAPRRYAWYDPSRPEPEQRNRVIDALEIIPPGAYEASRIYAEVMAPSGVHRHRQPRALICDGPLLLAWFGSFNAVPFDRRQRLLLSSLVPAVRRRLRIERRLQCGPSQSSILEHVLDRLGAPAFVIGARGRLFEANRSGRVMLKTCREEIVAALDAALARRPSGMAIELTPIVDAGSPACWLAIVRAGSADARIVTAVATASARWKITPRQQGVLELVLRGNANTTIAAQLGVSERTVELHVSALFDRIGVENRASLVAVVLTA